ncbi:MAG TPA: hypothetical protein VKT29_03475 [Terriglobales bacterium]|nr:hypothetical protein [Terriglobales bacterium]
MATVLCVGGESLHTRQPLLRSAGFEVLTAIDESASLAVSRWANVDAVILDSHSAIPNLTHLAAELKSGNPALAVLLVTDCGAEDAEPSVFDRVISRLDGPTTLLLTLRELTSGVISISGTAKSSARELRSSSRKLRERLAETRRNLRNLREKLSRRR